MLLFYCDFFASVGEFDCLCESLFLVAYDVGQCAADASAGVLQEKEEGCPNDILYWRGDIQQNTFQVLFQVFSDLL